jgi:pilus assembly protein CpaB
VSRRTRSLLFAGLAIGCALAAASITAGYRERADSAYGELRPVLVASRSLPKGSELSPKALERGVEQRNVPAAFAPPDALADPSQALGRSPAVAIPAGSYLSGSLLRDPASVGPRPERVEAGLRPVEVRISGGGAIVPLGPGVEVDVVAAEEPFAGGSPRVRVLARAVELVDLREDAAGAESPGEAWLATLALERRTALRVIEADNFAREVRLIPR